MNQSYIRSSGYDPRGPGADDREEQEPTDRETCRAGLFEEARESFEASRQMGVVHSPEDVELQELYTERRKLQQEIAADKAAIEACETTLRRSNLRAETIAQREADIIKAQQAITGWERDLAPIEAQIKAIQDKLDEARRKLEFAVTAELLSDFGPVVYEDAIPKMVIVAGETPPFSIAILNRGSYAFEVGVLSDQPRRMYRFGFELNVYAPSPGYVLNGSEGRKAEPAQINWGGIGSQAPADARTFARLLTLAADLAEKVNNVFGL